MIGKELDSISSGWSHLAYRAFYWLFIIRRRAQPRDLLLTTNCFAWKIYFVDKLSILLALRSSFYNHLRPKKTKSNMGSFKQRFKNLTQRPKKDRETNGAQLPPTTRSHASDPSDPSITENHVQSSGPAGNLDKLSKPASVDYNATTVLGLPESPQPETTVPDSSSADTTPISLSDSNDPWALAYAILQKREPELVECYQTHLSLAQRNGSVDAADAVDADLSNPRSVESVMTRLLEDRKQKQWKVSLLGKDVKIREQTEKLAKFLLWADPVVKNAVSTQPYAALAWASVSLLLPVSQGNPLLSIYC